MELGPLSMPLSLAHGDFAPWNTRLGRDLFSSWIGSVPQKG